MVSYLDYYETRSSMHRILPARLIGWAVRTSFVAGALTLAAVPAHAQGSEPWITTWAATPAPRWAEELPAPFDVPEVLGDQTVRQIARISVGGEQVRVVISNEFGTRPVTIGSASVALSKGGSAIDEGSVSLRRLGIGRLTIGFIASQFRIHQIDPERPAPDALADQRKIGRDTVRCFARRAKHREAPAFGECHRDIHRMGKAENRNVKTDPIADRCPQ